MLLVVVGGIYRRFRGVILEFKRYALRKLLIVNCFFPKTSLHTIFFISENFRQSAVFP